MSLPVTIEGRHYELHKKTLASWSYFTPLVEGRWGDKRHELQLTTEQYRTWLNLTSKDSVVSYSSVIEVVDMLLPENDEWTTRVYLDDAVPQDQRMEHYERVGNYVRSMGKKMPYMGKRLGIHCNFSLYCDPIYNYKSSSPTQEERELLLAMRDLSLITGIVHDAWLRCRLEGLTPATGEELPWYMIRWQDVALVKYPNALREVECYRAPPKGMSNPEVSRGHRRDIIGILVDKSLDNQYKLIEGLTWSQLCVGKYLDQLPEDATTGSYRVIDFESMRLYMRLDGVKSVVTTGFQITDASLHHLYLAFLRRVHELRKTLPMYPITGSVASELSMVTSNSDSHPMKPVYLAHYVTTNVLNMGSALVETDHCGYKYVVPAKAYIITTNFSHVVQYGISTVGSEAMRLLAARLADLGDNDRCKLFRDLVEQHSTPENNDPVCLP